MLNNVPTIFNYEQQEIRMTIDEKGEPRWAAIDVCAALDIKNSSDAISKLDEDEKGVAITDTLGGKQSLTYVNESGLYELIFTSRKPEAKTFKRWIKQEVLPSIRKTGTYDVSGRLTELATRLNNLPQGLDATEIDGADTAVTRVRQTIAQVKAFLAEAEKKKRISSEESGDLARQLSSIDAHMHQLFTVIQKDLTLDEQLTTLLFEYRDALPAPQQQAQKLLA